MVLADIIDAITVNGGIAFDVRGCVRDHLLGLLCKDRDIEIFEMDSDRLSDILIPFGHVNRVRVSFGVIKLNTFDGMSLDFTLPRRESKTGQGHKGFQVNIAHSMAIAEAAARRDFTSMPRPW